jgi:hypothetical protein
MRTEAEKVLSEPPQNCFAANDSKKTSTGRVDAACRFLYDNLIKGA